jgi:LPS-assembly lipoprotein
MWWSDLRRLLLALLLPLVSACGFTPVLGEHGANALVEEKLAQISVAPMPGIVGVYLRNDLLDRLRAEDKPTAASHRLEVGLSSGLVGSLVEPDASVTRYSLMLGASYKLIDLSSNAIVLEGNTEATSAYNVVESEYATLVARRDAERRAAKMLSDDLSLRLALFFAQ